jgi:hypothetical protein
MLERDGPQSNFAQLGVDKILSKVVYPIRAVRATCKYAPGAYVPPYALCWLVDAPFR